MKKKLLIFGTGKISQVVSFYFERDSEYDIIAHVADDDYVKEARFNDKPVIALSACGGQFSNKEHHVFVAVGYQGMNQLRTSKVEHFRKLGYAFASYQSPFVKGNYILGENSIVMDGAAVQPFAQFGNNVFVWGGAMVGHHAIVEDHCWITGSCMIGGSAKVGAGTFIGLGAIIGHEVTVGEKCMLGAGTVACKSLAAGTVLVAPDTAVHRLNSEQFTRMSSCFKSGS